jgi:hypothetical protein
MRGCGESILTCILRGRSKVRRYQREEVKGEKY